MERAEWVQFGAVLGLGAALYGTLALVERKGFRWDGLPSRSNDRWDKGIHPILVRIMGKSVRPAGWVIAVGLFLPMSVLDTVPRSLTLAALGASLFAAVLFPWRFRRSRSAVCYGLKYACFVVFLWVLQTAPGLPRWMPVYLAGLSAAVLFWVLLKMKYRGHRDIVLFSSFETLLIGTSLGASLFVPVVLAPALGLGEGPQRLLLAVCLESVVLLLAMKLIVVHQPGRSPVIAASLLLALSIVAMKGFLPDSIDPIKAFAGRAPSAGATLVPASAAGKGDVPGTAANQGAVAELSSRDAVVPARSARRKKAPILSARSVLRPVSASPRLPYPR
jgi:hypothetical protein